MKNRKFYNEYIKYLPINIKQPKIIDKKYLKKDKEKIKRKIKSAFLGVLIGDYAGSFVEGLNYKEIKQKYGYIKNFNPYCKFTDDSQLTLWYLSSLILNNKFIPEDIAYSFAFKGNIINAGKTIKKFLYNYRIQELPWYKAGIESAGNGAVMRILPASIWELDSLYYVQLQSAISTIITHNDLMAIASSILFNTAIWHNYFLKDNFFKDFKDKNIILYYMDTILENINYIEKGKIYKDKSGNTTNLYKKMKEIFDYINYEKDDFSYIIEVCKKLKNSAYVLETLPFVFFLFFQTKANFEKALFYAVNCGNDSDTIAALTSALILSYQSLDHLNKKYIKAIENFKEYKYIQELLDIYFKNRFIHLI